MRKAIVLAGACALALTLAGCGGTVPQTSGASAASQRVAVSDNPLEASLEKAQADCSDTSQKILDEQQKMFSEVGTTLDEYLANVDKVQAWYDLAVSESEALAERLVGYGREYYQLVVDNVDVTDDRELDKATEDFYDAVYEDALDDYYDTVYEDAFEEAYDAYYDGIISDAYDTVPYEDYFDARSDAYDMWFDARSDVYDAWFDARSDLYSDYSDVRSAFYQNDFDVEGVFAPVEVNPSSDADGEAPAPSEDAGATDSDDGADTSGVSPDFKSAMDGYEAFFDEYAEFMKAYQANPSSPDLLFQYPDIMARYADVMSALDGIDEDGLSAADYTYYVEVNGRIATKLAEIA